MKKAAITIVILFFSFSLSFAQESIIKNYPLKDYVAPEIKYRLLDLDTNLNLYGEQENENNNANRNEINLNLDLDYYQYVNTSKFQGILNTVFYSRYRYLNSIENDTLQTTYNSLQLDLDYSGQNRFYFKEMVFIGVNGFASFQSQPIEEVTRQENQSH